MLLKCIAWASLFIAVQQHIFADSRTLSKAEAVRLVGDFFKSGPLVIATPKLKGEGPPESSELVDPDVARIGQLLTSVIIETKYRFGCFTPRHIFRVKDHPERGSISVCFECRRAFLYRSGDYLWFEVEPTTEKEINEVFLKYGVRGSTKAHRPNQALEPTITAVTPRADARVAPAVIVAHL